MKRLVILGATGWAGIVALSWWLADNRARLCWSNDDSLYGSWNRSCLIRAYAARDNALIWQLGIGLALVLVIAASTRLGHFRRRPTGVHSPTGTTAPTASRLP